MTTKEKTEHSIDATGKKLGRVASGVAHILLGKNSTSFAKNVVAQIHVTVENVELLDVPERKRTGKIYTRYSGYPGGLKKATLKEVIDKKGMGEALSMAVKNMLPNNRLRKARMKNLVIK